MNSFDPAQKQRENNQTQFRTSKGSKDDYGGHEADIELSMSDEYDRDRAANSIERLITKMNNSD